MRRFIQQRCERLVRLAKPVVRIRRAPTKSAKLPFIWEWNGLRVAAFAKTDARGKLKRLAGLKRLPVGAVVKKVGLGQRC